jgi:hypothetical protein
MTKKLTVKEFQELAQISQMTAYNLVWKGKVEARRVDGRWEISAASAKAYIEGRLK